MDSHDYDILYYTVDPVTSDVALRLKERLTAVYTQIKAKAYFVTNDIIKIFYDEKSPPFKLYRVPAALIAAHLVNRSSSLLEGAPGSGKTKIAKITSRLMTGSSLNDAENIIYCDEELSKEKWMAFPDVKKMMHGKNDTVEDAMHSIDKWLHLPGTDDVLKAARTDPKAIKTFLAALEKAMKIPGNDPMTSSSGFEVIWSPFFKMERCGIDIIIDEINRTNPKTQNEFLSLMAEGIAQYAVPARAKIEDFRIFFTQNPLDDIIGGIGIHSLDNAFKDRITQCLQVPQPPMYAMKMVSDVRKDDRNYEYNEDAEIIPVMTVDDVRNATILASKIPVTPDAHRFARYIVRDLSLCLKAPKNDKSLSKTEIAGRGLCDGCHLVSNTEYHCQKFYGGSMRMYNDLLAMGKAYAFWLGLEEVNEYLLKSITVDIISHRIFILPEKMRDDKKYGKDARKFIEHYLVDECFKRLQTRKVAEGAYDRLYHGKSDNPDEDVQMIKMHAQNDPFVRIDLLPKVMEIDEDDVENLIEKKTPVLSSTNDARYRRKVMEINSVMEDDSTSYKQKKDSLNAISIQIAGDDIPFSSNLIDMIYAMYPKIESLRVKDVIRQEEEKKRRGG